MLLGALVQREQWLGRAIRSAYVQRGRYVVPSDITADTEERQQLATRCAGYKCNQRQADYHRPHLRLFRRDGDNILGSRGLIHVSTNSICSRNRAPLIKLLTTLLNLSIFLAT